MKRLVVFFLLAACGEEKFDLDGDGYVDCHRYQESARLSDAHDCFHPPEGEEAGPEPWYVNPKVHDCDDRDVYVHPDADEPCDGIDNDCDGLLDGADPDAAQNDCDGDGRSGLDSDPFVLPDCDDNDDNRSPDLFEVCDGVDNDCDGLVDNMDGCDAPPVEEEEFFSMVYGGGGCQSAPSSLALGFLAPLLFTRRRPTARSHT